MAVAISSITLLPKNDPLESLHSPDVIDFADKDREVDTVVSATDTEFNEIALDDETLKSPVYLTRDPSPSQGPNDLEPPSTARPPIASTPPEALSNSQSVKTHKKSTSNSTIRSGNNLSFIVSRLQDEYRSSLRGSVDGQQKLQEEFARLHKEEEETTSTEMTGVHKTIDWGISGAQSSLVFEKLTVSTYISHIPVGGLDYQGFAADRPEELASAIARGIPDTLRGMMWQHMAASKDTELEGVYLKLLKEESTHEKAITRDLGRYQFALPKQVPAIISLKTL
ncbi:hypothetical protein C0993_001677 [Termitomyces sp. T159_Od127]|nr:hypothetical protein C0993_001677 [Termitomyces sp. T159_Od127]